MPRLCFKILPPIDRASESISIHIDLDEPAGGISTRTLPLRWEEPFHVGELDLEQNGELRFRIVRSNSSIPEVDACGNPIGDRVHEAWVDDTLEIVVADWKDRHAGQVERVSVPGQFFTDRELVVWLPPSYFREELTQFPLIFGLDGGRLIDPLTSPAGIDWGMDEWIRLLGCRGILPETILVGLVARSGVSEDGVLLRDIELSQEREGEMLSRYIVEEVVPFLDRRYRTIQKSSFRTIVGAGLGGVRAFWTALEYPAVFANAACLSTSFEDISQAVPGCSRSLIGLEEGVFPPTDGRFYFDYGDVGLDECYEIYHTILSSLLREKGWLAGKHMEIRRICAGAHDDLSWRHRIGGALQWLCS